MPSKGKAAAKPKEAAQPAKQAALPPPSTINERTQQRSAAHNSVAADLDSRAKANGLSSLTPSEQNLWLSKRLLRTHRARQQLAGSTKAHRDAWRHVNEASLPVRTLRKQQHDHAYRWGTEKSGGDVGELSIERFDARVAQQARLTALTIASRAFAARRERAAAGAVDPLTGQAEAVCENEVEEERVRRKDMAKLRAELYGERTGPYAQDPEWDDVEPVPQNEPEGALAAIAYPEDYAEAISYLRAVMISKEYSPRCLKLTEHIISLNPAHYTVWLYRASIVTAMKLPIPDEIEWLNEVALENLKNYQIWHHRHLLIEAHYPAIAADEAAVKALARSETDFLALMLAEDTKNYHVWSYRSFLVRKLGMWGEDERRATEAMILDDVRNNSAWSHRFFVVFSDPANGDGVPPGEVVDREVAFAKEKIALAPQNQSPWNYLRGVLTKGGRPLRDVEEFAGQFVRHLGDEKEEEVKSSHALDLLAEIYAEKGEKEKAELCLTRLAEKWDRIRAAYWSWRKTMLADDKGA